MIMGVECVPELKINLAQLGVLDQEHWDIWALWR